MHTMQKLGTPFVVFQVLVFLYSDGPYSVVRKHQGEEVRYRGKVVYVRYSGI